VTPNPNIFKARISVAVQDKWMFIIDHEEESAHAESDGHVTDEVRLPQKVKVVMQYIKAPYLRKNAK